MNRLIVPILLVLAGYHLSAHAGVVVGGTRLIYKGEVQDASIGLENTGKESFLVQSWVEDEKGGSAQSVFLVTPPLFRMGPESSNLLRVVKMSSLPEDKESLFWFNVRSIPSTNNKVDANQLTLSVQSRIKLIYRPEALLGVAIDKVAANLTWRCDDRGGRVTNDSQYYMNFASVVINGVEVKAPGYVAPGQSKHFEVPNPAVSCAISWQVINDYGSAGQVHSNHGVAKRSRG
jgi:fimbrial chaperone protein